MYVITEYEKQKAFEFSDSLWSNLLNSTDRILFYKILYNFIVKTNSPKQISFNEKVLRDKVLMKKSFDELIHYMVDIAADDTDVKQYTTGLIAKYFGVSVTSVNNWINEGRFSVVLKEGRNKQARIPENSTWKTNSGELFSVKEIISDWEANYAKFQNVTKEQEHAAIQDEIEFYVRKYNGTLENTLLRKEKLSEEELADLKEWKYWLQRANE